MGFAELGVEWTRQPTVLRALVLSQGLGLQVSPLINSNPTVAAPAKP